MERSQHVLDAYIRLLENVSRGTASSAYETAFVGDGASIVGTNQDEWWIGAATRQAWTAVAHTFRETETTIVPDQPEAYAEGSIGWVIDRPTFRNVTGSAMQTRMTTLFRLEEGTWIPIHVHNSLGVPSEQGEAARSS